MRMAASHQDHVAGRRTAHGARGPESAANGVASGLQPWRNGSISVRSIDPRSKRRATPVWSMARVRPVTADPAADAALLLRRLAFAILMLAIPLATLVARRALVILAPIAVVLLVIAAAIDGSARPLAASARRVFISPGGLAGALLLAWCALSL